MKGKVEGKTTPSRFLDPSKEAAVKALCNNAPKGAYVCIKDMKLYDWKVVTDPRTGVTLCPDCASDVTPAAFWDDKVKFDPTKDTPTTDKEWRAVRTARKLGLRPDTHTKYASEVM